MAPTRQRGARCCARAPAAPHRGWAVLLAVSWAARAAGPDLSKLVFKQSVVEGLCRTLHQGTCGAPISLVGDRMAVLRPWHIARFCRAGTVIATLIGLTWAASALLRPHCRPDRLADHRRHGPLPRCSSQWWWPVQGPAFHGHLALALTLGPPWRAHPGAGGVLREPDLCSPYGRSATAGSIATRHLTPNSSGLHPLASLFVALTIVAKRSQLHRAGRAVADADLGKTLAEGFSFASSSRAAAVRLGRDHRARHSLKPSATIARRIDPKGGWRCRCPRRAQAGSGPAAPATIPPPIRWWSKARRLRSTAARQRGHAV